jgi:hypothetical protein
MIRSGARWTMMAIGELVRHKTALEWGVDVVVGIGGSDTKCWINFDSRKQAIQIVAIAMAACSTVKVPVDTSSTPIDTGAAARVVLEDSLAAKGGKAKLARLQSLRLNGVGTSTSEGKSTPFELTRVLVLPDKMRVDYTISFPASPHVTASTAISGDTGWQRLVDPKMKEDVSSDLVGSNLQTVKLERWRDPDLILLNAVDLSAEVMLLPDDVVAGGDLYSVVRLRPPFGNVDLFLYIDKKSKLLSRVITSDGRNTEADELGEYREVSGLQFAYKRTTKRDDATNTLELKTVEVDAEIDLTLFDKPAAKVHEPSESTTAEMSPPWVTGNIAAQQPSTELAPPPPPPPPPPPSPPTNVSPKALEANRIAGEKNILPDDITRAEILQSGKGELIGSFKLCISTAGSVTGVSVLKSTTFPAYDVRITAELRKWEYTPFLISGKPAAVCTAVTFIYSQREPPPSSKP